MISNGTVRDTYDPKHAPKHSLDEQILLQLRKECDISRARLSAKLNVSDSTIKRAIKRLSDEG